MVTILFWNMAKNVRSLGHLPFLQRTHSIDVFILVESPKNLKPAIRGLNAIGNGTFREEANAKAKVRALTRMGTKDFAHLYTSTGREMGVWSVTAPQLSPKEALIAGVHLPSKAGGNQDTDQASIAKEVIEELVEVEDGQHHRNTAIVGDFNMHPYDRGMTSVTGIHGLMTKELARLPDRVHRRRPRRRFYNPMWGLFGDTTPGPAGSHYWRSSVLHNPHWGILDQVLLRPALMDRLPCLSILDNDGTHSLMSADGAPDKRHVSDHLPVLFQLDI